jgi:hypothetical protein
VNFSRAFVTKPRILSVCAMIAAVSPLTTASAESPFCFLPPDPAAAWLPVTPVPNETNVPAPRPASDCQFYRPAWQRFLYATQPVGGMPRFVRFPSFEQIFQPAKTTPAESAEIVVLNLSPRNIQRPNDATGPQQKLLDDTQAGIGGGPGGNLIDQHGHLVYYAIHANPALLQFLQNENLTTVDGIKKLDPSLTFLGSDSDIAAGINTDVVEYKSAWMIVDSDHPPPNYFVMSAQIPHLIVSGGKLVQEIRNGNPVTDKVYVALLALHVVFTLPGHPEMIWSTFEHVRSDRSGKIVRDNAPAAPDNPSNTPPATKISHEEDFPLYKANTAAQDANQPLDLSKIIQFWDSRSQSFKKPDGTSIQTSVYRPYPGSKTDGSTANPSHEEDDEVKATNDHATAMFNGAMAKGLITSEDKRQHYRLVGAIWLDQPATSFQVRRSFSIASDQSTDDNGQPLAGEGRLGSTAMESFTEFEEGAPNCFSCHDTNAVRDKKVLIPPARLNVSHILSKFIDSQTSQP